MELWDAAGRMKLGQDSWFLYTAYATLSDEQTLIKVGISTIPYQRLVAIHCNSPFPVDLAAFALMGRKKSALRAERIILAQFAKYKTRGEWLLVPTTTEIKREFAEASRSVVEQVTGKPVKWQKATGAQIKAYMSSKMKDHFAA